MGGGSTLSIIAAILCGLLAYFVIQAVFYPDSACASMCPRISSNELKTRDDVFKTIQSTTPVTILYYAPWCGHCQTVKPAFERAARRSTNRMVMCNADPMATATKGHSGILGLEDLETLKVDGFPSIQRYQNGTVQDYTGPRSEDAFLSFANDIR